VRRAELRPIQRGCATRVAGDSGGLDAKGKPLLSKHRAAGSDVLGQMADCIDHVSAANDDTPRWKWAPMP
jgi:hypothetical protein